MVALFWERLGYDYLGNRIDRDNCNIEPELGENTVTVWLNPPDISPIPSPDCFSTGSCCDCCGVIFARRD